MPFENVNSVSKIRLGIDIGGTFTDVALEMGERRFTAKTLTTPSAPEAGGLDVVRSVMAAACVEPGQVDLLIHGTTLATNALIERKGAKTALLTTEGFRDVLEIRNENQGRVLVPLDASSLARAIDFIASQQIEAVAVGLLHSFTNPDHEHRVRDAMARRLPDLTVTLSSEVSPEMREYERFSTACANAYIQPLMWR